MGHHDSPKNIAANSQNSIHDNATPHSNLYVAIAGPNGLAVYRNHEQENLLDKLVGREAEVAQMWGAPSISWRPSDGRLIVVSVEHADHHGEHHGYMSLPVPTAYMDGPREE